jgi:serine/threonine-protein kinase
VLQTGDQIGRYQVEGLIGQGGLAKVYRVRHTTLGTTMALKVLVVKGSAIGRRLIREGRIQARLAHPNVVNVTDVVEHEGRAGLLMEYVEGVGLDTYLGRTGALALSDALGIFNQIMAGMIAAHDAQVLHRDLKPANILLSSSPQGTVAKVTDFGIAKVLQGDDDGRHTGGDTLQGDLIGTPGYMPPEQVADPTRLDERADVYSLGAVLYCMITGRPPFLPGASLAQTLHLAESGDFPPVQSLRPDCPPALAAAIEACLSPDPDGRPATVRELARLVHGDHHSVLQTTPAAVATALGTPLASETLAPLTPTDLSVAGVAKVPRTDPTAVPEAAHLDDGGTVHPGAQSLAPKRAVASPPDAPAPSPDAPEPQPSAPATTLPGPPPRRRGWIVGAALLVGLVVVAVVWPDHTPAPVAAPVSAPTAAPAPTPAPPTPEQTPAAAPTPAPEAAPEPGAPRPEAAPAADPQSGNTPREQPAAADPEPIPPATAPPAAADPIPEEPPAEEPAAEQPSAAEPPTAEPSPAEPEPAPAEPAPEAPAAADPAPPDPSEPPAVAEAEPDAASTEPEAPPPPAAVSVMGTWQGRWAGRPITIRIQRQSDTAVAGSLEVFQGQGIRTIELVGRVDAAGALSLSEAGGGWTIRGTVQGRAFDGTIQAPQMRKPARLSAQLQ